MSANRQHQLSAFLTFVIILRDTVRRTDVHQPDSFKEAHWGRRIFRPQNCQRQHGISIIFLHFSPLSSSYVAPPWHSSTRHIQEKKSKGKMSFRSQYCQSQPNAHFKANLLLGQVLVHQTEVWLNTLHHEKVPVHRRAKKKSHPLEKRASP